MSTVNWTPKFKNADGDEVELILGVDQVANSDGTPLTEFIANMGESNDLTYTELAEAIDGESPDVSPVVQNAIQDAVDGITAEQVGALPTTGGTVTGNTTFKNNVFIERTQSDGTVVKSGLFPANYKIGSGDKNNYVTSIGHDRNGEGKALFAFNENGAIVRDVANSKVRIIIDNQNMGEHVLPLTGGTLSGMLSVNHNSVIPLVIKATEQTASYAQFAGKSGPFGYIGFSGVDKPSFSNSTGSYRYDIYSTHNITNGTSALTAGTSALATGNIYLQYS